MLIARPSVQRLSSAMGAGCVGRREWFCACAHHFPGWRRGVGLLAIVPVLFFRNRSRLAVSRPRKLREQNGSRGSPESKTGEVEPPLAVDEPIPLPQYPRPQMVR